MEFNTPTRPISILLSCRVDRRSVFAFSSLVCVMAELSMMTKHRSRYCATKSSNWAVWEQIVLSCSVRSEWNWGAEEQLVIGISVQNTVRNSNVNMAFGTSLGSIPGKVAIIKGMTWVGASR